MQETSAQAYGRALAVWGQWLRLYRHARAPRALQTALICSEIAAEKLVNWRAELKLNRSAGRAAQEEQAERRALALNEVLREIKDDERVLRAMRVTV
jgi:hypothetical protein